MNKRTETIVVIALLVLAIGVLLAAIWSQHAEDQQKLEDQQRAAAKLYENKWDAPINEEKIYEQTHSDIQDHELYMHLQSVRDRHSFECSCPDGFCKHEAGEWICVAKPPK